MIIPMTGALPFSLPSSARGTDIAKSITTLHGIQATECMSPVVRESRAQGDRGTQ